MMAQARTVDQAERQKLFADVQRLMAEQVPLINLAARNLVVAARRRVGNLKPGLLHDFLLWNAEELFLRPVVSRQ
jgi:ABC-type transport system substrate-binding protein